MAKGDKTNIGGQNEAFQTTHWTQILDTRTLDPDRRRETMEGLLGRYWKPVYCYLRGKGHDNESAKDLTQGFFHQIVLGRELIQQADRKKGKFRTFLLTALDRYVVSTRRAARARKRTPAGGLIRLDAAEGASMPVPASSATPEQAFAYAWASVLLDEATEEVKRGCCRSGQAVHWQLFLARVLRPMMLDAEQVPLRDLCAEHGISDEAKASNMVVTVKRRFQRVLRNRVRQFVSSDVEVDEEIRDLMRMLSRDGAGS